MSDIYKYVGQIQPGAKIVENTSFETLNNEKAFLKRQLVLVFHDGVSVLLADPDYLEFPNSPKGRDRLNASGLNPNHISAILLVWGDKSTVNDPEE